MAKLFRIQGIDSTMTLFDWTAAVKLPVAGLVLLQDGNNLLFRMPLALHRLVLPRGQTPVHPWISSRAQRQSVRAMTGRWRRWRARVPTMGVGSQALTERPLDRSNARYRPYDDFWIPHGLRHVLPGQIEDEVLGRQKPHALPGQIEDEVLGR
jgi:hypothetical protein